MRPSELRNIVCASVLGLLFSAGSAAAETWALQFVDVGSSSGPATSLGLSEEGFPVIAYHSATSRKLRFAFLNPLDKTWHIQVVDAGGEFTSLAVDSTGIVHVAYLDAFTLQLKHWSKNQAQEQIDVIDSEPNQGGIAFYHQIRVDGQGRPQISYYHYRNPDGSISDDLKYAVLNGTTWTREFIDRDAERGKYNSLALDASGNPQISYFDNVGTLRYAKRAPGGGAWTTQAVDSTGDSGRFNSIAVDALGHPHISYIAAAFSRLRYATFDGVSWKSEDVDNNGTVVNFSVTSIALDKAGNPHISYYDATAHSLRYAYRLGGVWYTQTVDREGDVGGYSSLQLDAQDRPIISYYDATSRALKIAYGDYPDADGDGIPDSFDSCPGNPDCNGNSIVDGREGGVLDATTLVSKSGGNLLGDESLFGCGTLAAVGGGSWKPPGGGPPPADLVLLFAPAAYLLMRRRLRTPRV